MDQINIKLLSECPHYLDNVASWVYSEWGHYYPGESHEDFKNQIVLSLEESNLPFTLVALEGDQIVGTISLLHGRGEAPPGYEGYGPWLGSLYVCSQKRGAGLGKLLVSKLVARAKNLNLKSLFLWTSDQVAWYEKLGWGRFSEAEFHGRTVTVMQLDLVRH